MIDDMTLQPMVAAAYLGLADALAAAPDSDWDAPSLCDGWRVREVIAHMTMPARYDEDSFMAELRACNFDFGRLSNELATRDAQLATADLLAGLRADVMRHWTPPGGGYHGALNHVVVHGLDVTLPLQLPSQPPPATMHVVLDDLTEGGVHQHFGTVLGSRRLEATDLDWSYGSGPVLRGTAGDLAAALCGRKLSSERFEGEPL